MLYNRRMLVAFFVSFMMVLTLMGCSSSGDDAKTAKAAAQEGESGFELVSYFTETRPKVRLEKKQTCHGENLSPDLSWINAPGDTVSYALVVEDLDNRAGAWVHWVLYNIPSGVTELAEGIPTSTSELLDGTTQGTNDNKRIGYEGPCPVQMTIPGEGQGHNNPKYLLQDMAAHKYRFTLYSLGTDLSLAPGANKIELMEAMEGQILAEAVRDGKFQLGIETPMSAEFKKDAMGCGSTCQAAKTAEALKSLTPKPSK